MPEGIVSVSQIEQCVAFAFHCDVCEFGDFEMLSNARSFGFASERRPAVNVLNLASDGPREPAEWVDSLEGNRLLILELLETTG